MLGDHCGYRLDRMLELVRLVSQPSSSLMIFFKGCYAPAVCCPGLPSHSKEGEDPSSQLGVYILYIIYVFVYDGVELGKYGLNNFSVLIDFDIYYYIDLNINVSVCKESIYLS